MERIGSQFKRPQVGFYRSPSDGCRTRRKTAPSVSSPSSERKNENEDVTMMYTYTKDNTDCAPDYHEVNHEFNDETDQDKKLHLSTDDEISGFHFNEVNMLNQSNTEKKLLPHVHYSQLLIQFEYVTELENCTSYAVCDYDVERRHIKYTSYIFLHRSAHKSPIGNEWAFSCSCDRSRMEFVNALNSDVNDELDKVIPYAKCLHILAMEVYFGHFDSKCNIKVEEIYDQRIKSCEEKEHAYSQEEPPQVAFRSLPSGSSWIAVKPPTHSWGICTFVYTKVTPPSPQLRCNTCHGLHCNHTAAVASEIETETDWDESPLALFKFSMEVSPEMRKYFQLVSQSKKKVPLFLSEGDHSDVSAYQNLPKKNGVCVLVPNSDGVCQCGESWIEEPVQDKWLHVQNSVIACMYSVTYVNVYFRPCSACSNKKSYDGYENNIVWFGSYGVSHAVLKDYIHLFLASGLPMYRYYVAYLHRQFSAGNFNFGQIINYTKFRLAVLAMIRLLDIDFECGFRCPDCGVGPDKIVMDGTTLGIQKTFLPVIENEAQFNDEIHDGRFETRNFINRRSVRALLKSLVNGAISENEIQQLKEEVASAGLKTFLVYLEEHDMLFKMPKCVKRLLLALASDKSVCSIIPPTPDVINLLMAMSNGFDPFSNASIDLKLLQDHVPLIFNLLGECGGVHESLHLLFRDLAQKSLSPFQDNDGHCRKAHPLKPCDDNCDSFGYFPCLPQIVKRGSYILDNKNPQLGDCFKGGKSTKRNFTLVPGIFTLFCTHGISYGFQLMRDHESPNVPFTIIRTRFPEAPSLAIYDNSCRLHEYSLNRDPAFFKKTKFVVDKFHWKNHKGCSEGYNITLYPTLRNYNTQIAEQVNSVIKPLASMVSYMEYENFMMFCKLYIWHKNMIRLLWTFPEGAFQYKEFFLQLSKTLHR